MPIARADSNMSEGTKIRIAKRMADAGVCSRREAERWIAEGRVVVNGVCIDTPATLVGPEDQVSVDGTMLGANSAERLFLYHKPTGQLTTHRDPEGRETVFEALPKDLPRVVSVGRLDQNSEGLLLLTTSGALARLLELPSTGLERTYRVRVRGTPTAESIAQLKRGMTVEGVRYGPVIAELERGQSAGVNKWMLVTLTEGKNREIRRVFDHLGHSVSRLIRVSYGPFSLGKLPLGVVMEVKENEWRQMLAPVLAVAGAGKQAHTPKPPLALSKKSRPNPSPTPKKRSRKP
jgi:23S rRNA pseudouridine2605 synthase